MDWQILQTLLAIRNLVVVVIVVTGVLAIAFIASIVLNYRHTLENIKSGDFFARGNAMLNKGQLDELLELCDKHLSSLPADASAHWLKANALYRRKEWHKALISYRRADELQPGWSLGPAISELEEKVSQTGKAPDLKVVAPINPTGSPRPSDDDSRKGDA